MYNNIGLTSVRGTGTSGYVQKNVAALPKNRQPMSWEASLEYEEKVKQRKPVQLVADKEILEHERKKKIEIALLEWADATGLLDSGKPQEEIDRLMNEKRESIAAQQAKYGPPRGSSSSAPRSSHQDRYEKEQHQAKLASALGIRDDYKEGQAFDRDYQMQEREARAQQREKIELLKREEARIMRQLEETRSKKEQRGSGRGRDDSDNAEYSRRSRDRRSPPRRDSRDDRRRYDDSPSRGERRGRRSPSPSPPRGGRGNRSPSPSRTSPRSSPPRSRLSATSPTGSPTYSPPRHHFDRDEPRITSEMDVDAPLKDTRAASSHTPASASVDDTALNEVKTETKEETAPIKTEEKPSESSQMDVDSTETAAPKTHDASPTKISPAKKATATEMEDTSAVGEKEEEGDALPPKKTARGRGKKATAAATVEEEDDVHKETAEETGDQAEAIKDDSKPTPKKAGRGRGKKATAAATVNEDEDTSVNTESGETAHEEEASAAKQEKKPSPKKTGRSRAKKAAAAISAEKEEDDDVDHVEAEEEEPETPKRAKRGRAKKAVAGDDEDYEDAPKPKRAKRTAN